MLIVAGTFRVPPTAIEDFGPPMRSMLAASRAEDGCLAYSYALDVAEPGLVRVFEVWRDQASLDAHVRTAHLAAWRALWPRFGVSERRLIAYEVIGENPA